jgi:hypothetical protein
LQGFGRRFVLEVPYEATVNQVVEHVKSKHWNPAHATKPLRMSYCEQVPVMVNLSPGANGIHLAKEGKELFAKFVPLHPRPVLVQYSFEVPRAEKKKAIPTREAGGVRLPTTTLEPRSSFSSSSGVGI